jgi:hypothetical protein
MRALSTSCGQRGTETKHALSTSSRRTPGPIIPGRLLLQKVSHSSARPGGRGVWVPAFAGTTQKEFEFQTTKATFSTVIASEAKQSMHRQERMDCFVPEPVIGPAERPDPLASRNDAKTQLRIPGACFARVSAGSFRPLIQRAQGKPGADCTHGSRAKKARG